MFTGHLSKALDCEFERRFTIDKDDEFEERADMGNYVVLIYHFTNIIVLLYMNYNNKLTFYQTAVVSLFHWSQ